MTKAITDSSFDTEVLNNSKPVVVDFWAEWCGPCKMVASVLDELANEMAEKVDIAKVNIEENPNTPTKYAIRSIPTLLLFKDGQQVDTKVGAVSKEALKEWIESNL